MARTLVLLTLKRKRSMQQQANASSSSNNSGAAIDPFTMITKDIHVYILSFLTTLNNGWARPARDARLLYVEAHRKQYIIDNPSVWNIDSILESEFEALEEQSKWNKLAVQDCQRYQQEDAVYTRPDQLVQVCQNLALVSTTWRNVVGEVTNAQAPANIITPLNLSCLKSRALSLDLSSICKHFECAVQEKWGNCTFPDQNNDDITYRHLQDDMSPLETMTDYFYFESIGYQNVIATEYLRFLVVKCVEALANMCDKAWKEPCQPCELVRMFWQVHMQSPKKYARDCHALLGPLLHVENAMDTIIDCCNAQVSTVVPGSDYWSKRAILFHFERQLARSDCFHGRFGDYWMPPQTRLLFEENFNVVRVAEECKSDSDDEKWSL